MNKIMLSQEGWCCFTPTFPYVQSMADPYQGRRDTYHRSNDRGCVASVTRSDGGNSDHRWRLWHCEFDAICSEDLPRYHAGSPLDQFVSQSRRYRRRRHSSSARTREERLWEMRLIRQYFLLLGRSFLQGFAVAYVTASVCQLSC